MTTVGPTNLPAFFNTDADFRLWGSTISAALATIGLVQTADTGQINWTTVTKPSVVGTAQGYEIWRFADTLQGTVPVYIKIEYGSASAATTAPSLWWTVGQGSNGSGTITGSSSGRKGASANSAKSAGVTLPTYVSGNSAEVFVVSNLDVGNNAFGLSCFVERPKDTTDATTGEGVLFIYGDSGDNLNNVFVPATGTVPGANGVLQGPFANAWSRSSSGGNVCVTPVFIPVLGVWRMSHVNGHKIGDLTAGGSYTTTIFGAVHTYMSVDNLAGPPNVGGAGAGNCGMSFRWE